MFDRINIFSIITNHFKTLRSLRSNSKSITTEDSFMFLVFPLLIAFILAYKKVWMDSQVSNLIAVISIFGGFLFNLLAIIYGYLDKAKDKINDPIKKTFAKEINVNISFNILLSIFTTFSLVIYNMIPEKCSRFYLNIKLGLLGINYFLLLLFFLTLLMVLNRVYILLQKEND